MLNRHPKFKLVLVPVLAGVLGIILIRDSSKEPDSEQVALKNKGGLVSTKKSVVWPEFELDEIARMQPFQTIKQPDTTRSAGGSVQNAEAPFASGQGTPPTEILEVRAIFQTPQGASAILGNRVVRVGDLLSNGKRVSAIRPDGVEVTEQQVDR